MSALSGFSNMATYNDQQDILNHLLMWLKQGEPCWLITVLSTWGSSPRPAGSWMTWSRAGQRGSLSGGCIEEDLVVQLAGQHWTGERPERLSYGVSAEQAYRMRLPCGGRMELLLEPVTPSPDTIALLESLLAALVQRQAVVRTVNLRTGTWDWQRITSSPGMSIAQPEPNTIRQYLGPDYRLLIIGANQIAEHLCLFSQPLNMQCAVCDPRPGAFDHWPYPWVTTSTMLPDDWLRTQTVDTHTAIVTLAHDPRIDDMALMHALNEPAYYIGALGSRRTAAARRERLRQLDIPSDNLARLTAPAGLSIGSRTPAQIAVAISADLIAHQHRLVAATQPETRPINE